MDFQGIIIQSIIVTVILSIGATIIHKYGNKDIFHPSKETDAKKMSNTERAKKTFLWWVVIGGLFWVTYKVFQIWVDSQVK